MGLFKVWEFDRRKFIAAKRQLLPQLCRQDGLITTSPLELMGGMPVAEDFPRRLQKLREQQRKSRRTLSELCGLQKDAVRRYERGEARPTYEALIQLAEYFEVSLDYLTGRSDYL